MDNDADNIIASASLLIALVTRLFMFFEKLASEEGAINRIDRYKVKKNSSIMTVDQLETHPEIVELAGTGYVANVIELAEEWRFSIYDAIAPPSFV